MPADSPAMEPPTTATVGKPGPDISPLDVARQIAFVRRSERGSHGCGEEVDAERGDHVWRVTGDDHWTTLVATDAAFAALGIEGGPGDDRFADVAAEMSGPEAGAVDDAVPPDAKAILVNDHAASDQFVKESNVASSPSAPARRTRGDSKQAKLIEMLKRPEGATIDEIAAAFGWQAHTVRDALAGALKKKLGLDVISEKIEGRGRVYRIEN